VSSGSLAEVMRPGGRLVVGCAGLQASVQDADEPVGELVQRGVVVGTTAALAVVLPQRVPQPLPGPGPFPDQRLVHPGNHLDRLGLGGITRHRTQLMGVGADHVGQHVRVGRIALGPGHPEAVPIPGRLQRIDREHHVSGGDQRLHPRTPIGLNPNRDLAGYILDIIAKLRADQRMQPRDPRDTLGQPRLGQPASSHIHQLNVVMVLRPVISHEQQRNSRPRRRSTAASGRTISDLMSSFQPR